MNPPSISLLALLTDSEGRILLVRRRDSLLWTLPGSPPHARVASRAEYLTACCSRQIGVRPDFIQPLAEFTFAGRIVAVGVDEIPARRARACRRIEEVQWFLPQALPLDLAPVARMAIAVLKDRVTPPPRPLMLVA